MKPVTWDADGEKAIFVSSRNSLTLTEGLSEPNSKSQIRLRNNQINEASILIKGRVFNQRYSWKPSSIHSYHVRGR